MPFISPQVFYLLSGYIMRSNAFAGFKAVGEGEAVKDESLESPSEIYSNIINEIIKELSVQGLLDTREFKKIIKQKNDLYNELLKQQKIN